MLDILMIALAAGLFAAGVGYAYVCERLWGSSMIFDDSLAGFVSLGLLFYLTYALLRPERFWAAMILAWLFLAGVSLSAARIGVFILLSRRRQVRKV